MKENQIDMLQSQVNDLKLLKDVHSNYGRVI